MADKEPSVSESIAMMLTSLSGSYNKKMRLLRKDTNALKIICFCSDLN
jgi:hypothetical protein